MSDMIEAAESALRRGFKDGISGPVVLEDLQVLVSEPGDDSHPGWCGPRVRAERPRFALKAWLKLQGADVAHLPPLVFHADNEPFIGEATVHSVAYSIGVSFAQQMMHELETGDFGLSGAGYAGGTPPARTAPDGAGTER